MTIIKGILILGFLISWISAAEAKNLLELMEKYKLSPGIKITKENAHLIRDLVPESYYLRTVNGEYVWTIGKLDPPNILEKVWDNQFYMRSEQNTGKYDVDEDSGIVDKETGKRPWPLGMGTPFPNINFDEDPRKVGAMIQWNAWSLGGVSGDSESVNANESLGPRGTPTRWLYAKNFRQFIEFRRNPIEINRPLVWQQIIFILQPSESFGTATLTWRWADSKKWDSVWNYIPSFRRIRRTSSANRSDQLLGTEATQDDVDVFNAKIEMFDWKYIGKRDMLLPFFVPLSQPEEDVTIKAVYEAKSAVTNSIYRQHPGAFEAPQMRIRIAYSESPQQCCVSWWIPTVLWVPVEVYIVEAIPKDPYYNFGRHVMYYEANTFHLTWKEVYNRNGEYWRSSWATPQWLRYGSGDKEFVIYESFVTCLVDERNNRGNCAMESMAPGAKQGIPNTYGIGTNPEIFTLSKFLEYGK